MTAHIIIIGQVQGVGFRQFVKYQAKKLNIKGWVKNLPDGTVEATIQGEKEKVEKLIDLARKGPFLSKVDDLLITEEEDGNFEIFEILS